MTPMTPMVQALQNLIIEIMVLPVRIINQVIESFSKHPRESILSLAIVISVMVIISLLCWAAEVWGKRMEKYLEKSQYKKAEEETSEK